MSDEIRRSSVTVKIYDEDEVRYIPDSPELRALQRQLKLGCQVLDMRKRSFFFFKRKLKPHEKRIELSKLQVED